MTTAALTLISTGFSIVGGLMEAKAQNEADAEAAQHNADVLNQQAHEDKAAASLQARERRRDTRQRIGTQTALLAADGQAVDEGDALRLQQDMQQRGDFLADLDEEEGERLAFAKQKDAQFGLDSSRRRIKSRGRTSLLNAATTGVGGFLKARRMY